MTDIQPLTSAMIKKQKGVITITFPNINVYLEPYIVCPKKVAQKAWIDKNRKGN